MRTEKISLRVPIELHEEIMNTNEHTTKNAKYLARLTREDKEIPAVGQTNTTEELKELLEDIREAIDSIPAAVRAEFD